MAIGFRSFKKAYCTSFGVAHSPAAEGGFPNTVSLKMAPKLLDFPYWFRKAYCSKSCFCKADDFSFRSVFSCSISASKTSGCSLTDAILSLHSLDKTLKRCLSLKLCLIKDRKSTKYSSSER